MDPCLTTSFHISTQPSPHLVATCHAPSRPISSCKTAPHTTSPHHVSPLITMHPRHVSACLTVSHHASPCLTNMLRERKKRAKRSETHTTHQAVLTLHAAASVLNQHPISASDPTLFQEEGALPTEADWRTSHQAGHRTRAHWPLPSSAQATQHSSRKREPC